MTVQLDPVVRDYREKQDNHLRNLNQYGTVVLLDTLDKLIAEDKHDTVYQIERRAKQGLIRQIISNLHGSEFHSIRIIQDNWVRGESYEAADWSLEEYLKEFVGLNDEES